MTNALAAARDATYLQALRLAGGNRTVAARALGVSRQAVQSWLDAHPVEAWEFATKRGPRPGTKYRPRVGKSSTKES